MQHRAEQTLANYNLNDDELDAVIQEWSESNIPEGCTPDFPIAILEKIARRYLLKKQGLWKDYRNRQIVYPLPKDE
jgi:hypothetical protein